MGQVSMATRDELVVALKGRYVSSNRHERGRILDEFVAVSGLHRKHAMRLLCAGQPGQRSGPRHARRLYDNAVRGALIVLWEASDRICGKRLRPLVPILIDAMEQHGHLRLTPEVRLSLLAMSAATIDRALHSVREPGGGRKRRHAPPSAAIRRSVAVRTFDGWDNPPPGYVEADLVAHSGPTAKGSFVQTLTLTDIATGWTECAPLLVREQKLLTEVLTEVLSEMRQRMPFPLLGQHGQRQRFHERDGQKLLRGSRVGVHAVSSVPQERSGLGRAEERCCLRHAVGYRRYEGLEAAAALARLYAALRLFVKFFQPSFKLATKHRDGAKVKKTYLPPATPCQRLLADTRTSEDVRRQVTATYTTLDPVRLLQTIREIQQELVAIADRPVIGELVAPNPSTLEQFLSGLRTAWQDGEVRPTSKPKEKARRGRRRPDPFVTVTALVRESFDAEPWRTSRELFERLQEVQPGVFPDGQLRTLQRRLKEWRREQAHKMVFGSGAAGETREELPFCRQT